MRASLDHMAEIHDLILAAIGAHRRASITRSRFLNEGGECGDLDEQYCSASMAAARRLAEIEPATLAGVRAILNYVDEGERVQGFPWDEVGTADCELFAWHMTLHRTLAKALNRLEGGLS
jgi:hypothetical protein